MNFKHVKATQERDQFPISINLPLNVYSDRFQSFHVIIVDNQQRQNVEYEKYLFLLFQVIDEDYHHQMVMHPK